MQINQTVRKIEKILTNKYKTTNYVDFVREIFPTVRIIPREKFRKEYTNFSSHIEGSTYIGDYQDPEGKKLIIHAVQLKKESYVESSRSTQRSYAKKLMESGNADAAMIAFYTEGDPKWRLSYVRLDYEIKFENGKLNTIENMTPAKRYSYLVGEDEPSHTAISRFYRFIMDDPNAAQPTLDDLEEAFSVEKVTDEFFQLYCEKFHQLREALERNPDFVIEAEQHNFTSEQFAKKLMGQIVFLYFLQKKGWLGVSAWPRELNEKEYKNAFYARGAKSRELIPKVYIRVEDNKYMLSGKALNNLSDEDECILASCVKGQPWGTGSHKFMRKLFDFSQKKKANFFDDYLEPLFYDALNVNRGEQGYDPALHCRIPFLSGGLFEPIDGYDWRHNDFAIPNEVFSNIVEKGERDADGILDIFDRYNFTMSEDEPLEREVAIDPEMLGKVFENLLEIRDRKSKGAFYTPREIVHYMCQEILIQYLANETGLKEQDIRDFILLGDFLKDEDTSKDRRMGSNDMLISEEIYKIDKEGSVVVNRLRDIDEALANIRVADPAVGSGAFPLGMLNEIVRARQNISAYMAISMTTYETRMMYNNERSPYNLKLQTIKNCIFAADIEPSAVDIAQLRLWLSLVIDDEINPSAQSPLDGHRNPIPLPNLECNIVCGNTLIDEYEGIRLVNYSDIIGTNAGAQQNIFQNAFDTILPLLLEAQNNLFGCEDTAKKQELKERIESLKNELVKSQMSMAKPGTWERYLDARRWASRPFVLWQIDFARVFREKGGFDVVIGNPPYIKERDNHNVFDAVNNTAFGKQYHQGKMDYWYYFLHKAIDISNKKGYISFITPRYWLNSTGATGVIKRIKNELSFVNIVDIGKLKVFDNVVGLHMIALYSKKHRNSIVYKKLSDNLKGISSTKTTDNVNVSMLDNATIISDNNEIVLEVRKEYKNCVELGSISDISQGVVEASDCVSNRLYAKYPREDVYVGKGIFVLTQEEVDALDLNTYEKAILVPYADGDNFSRYSITPAKRFLIYSDQDIKLKIARDPRYRHIKAHLDNMSDYITSSNKPYGIHRPRKKHYFESTKIIMPSMFADNNFVLDYSMRLYVGMSFSCILITNKLFLPEYVLAVLNSKVAHEWFYSFGKKRGAGVDIGVQKIRTFPVKRCDMSIQEDIAAKVRMMISDYSSNRALDKEVDDTILNLYSD